MDVYAQILGDRRQMLLFSQDLEISNEIASLLMEPRAGLYFDWGPDSGRYLQNVDRRPPSPDHSEFLEALGITALSRPPGAAEE